MINHTLWEGTTGAFPQPEYHLFQSMNQLETFVSEDVIDSFTDYGWDEIREDDAEKEMLAGGFERDGNGTWLLQEDGHEGDAGEPMSFQVGTWEWMDYVGELASDFWIEMNEFGIDADPILDRVGVPDWTVAMQYTGGGSPESTFNALYRDEATVWTGMEAMNVPSIVEAPSIGDPAEAGDTTEDWDEFDTAAMASRLGVTLDEDQYQQLVDTLAWVNNQILVRWGTAPLARSELMNDHTWNFADAAEYPELHRRLTFRQMADGSLQYVPEEER